MARRHRPTKLYFAACRFRCGVCPAGQAAEPKASEIKARIWRTGDPFILKAAADPGYCILHLPALRGQFYHSFYAKGYPLAAS